MTVGHMYRKLGAIWTCGSERQGPIVGYYVQPFRCVTIHYSKLYLQSLKTCILFIY